jgi:hypothetical protein
MAMTDLPDPAASMASFTRLAEITAAVAQRALRNPARAARPGGFSTSSEAGGVRG